MDEVDKHPKNIQQPLNTGDMSVGSCVKVLVDNDTHYGVIRWIGSHTNSNSEKLMAAIELVILVIIFFFFSLLNLIGIR